VSQVKKDILNGWKEIAAYVARDRRTVERWEKQRGLPVRRMPGAGRATVYALISELDEWLASSKPDEAEPEDAEQDLTVSGGAELFSWPSPAAKAQSGWQSQAQSREQEQDRLSAGTSLASAKALSAGAQALPNRTQAAEPSPDKVRLGKVWWAGSMPEPHAATGNSAAAWPTASRWEEIASWTILAGLGVIFALATPGVGWHLPSGLEPEKPSAESGEASSATGAASSGIPYRSKVAGVDDLYLGGVYSSEQRTPESLERAEREFASAIEKDPNYAPAYAGLANTYVLLREYYVMPDEEAFTKAKAAAEHAIALDPRLGEAHASLGFIDFFWSWDAASAEREFRTALAEDPASAHAHHWYGSMLTHEGRYQEALEQLNIAQRLEPTSAAILSTRALTLGLSGHRGEAVDMLEQLINESPGVSSPHAILAILSRVEPQDWGRYLDEMRLAGELRHSDETMQVSAAAEPALRKGGEHAMWATILATEEKLHPGSANRTFLMAEAEASLGQDDAAFADLNQLAQRHDPNMMGLIVDPTLAPLRRDRRFRQLLEAVGLPEPGTAGSRPSGHGPAGQAAPPQ
jgi:tetratricopeptide (TPR) repeat protein